MPPGVDSALGELLFLVAFLIVSLALGYEVFRLQGENTRLRQRVTRLEKEQPPDCEKGRPT